MSAQILLPTNHRFKNLTGQKFGRLTVIGYAGRNRHRQSLWLCQCSCGSDAKAIVVGALTNGHSKSCGCWSRENSAAIGRKGVKHGHSANGQKTPEYTIHTNMLQRCENPQHNSYSQYGGRGIAVCDRWRDSFQAFLDDMGQRPSKDHSIDRIDVNGPYSPENCRWATRKEQGRNQRTNRILTYRGESRCMSEWAEVCGVSYRLLKMRMRYGWSVERALTEPVHSKRRAT